MGGRGSTRWGSLRRHATCDEAWLRLPAKELRRLIGPEVCPEQLPGYLVARPRRVTVDVVFRVGAANIKVALPFEATYPNYGGLRWWLVCPWCGRRRSDLYMLRPNGPVWCRLCHGLRFYTQRINRYWRLNRRLDRCWLKMGGSQRGMANWPPKPKRMHWGTYSRLQEEWERINSAVWDEALWQARRLLVNIGAWPDSLRGSTG